MKISKDGGRRYFYFGPDDRYYITFRNDWEQFPFTRSRYNWIDFAFISLNIERDYTMSGFELNAAFMGLGFFMRFNYADMEDSEPMKNLRVMLDEMDQEEETTPPAEILLHTPTPGGPDMSPVIHPDYPEPRKG